MLAKFSSKAKNNNNERKKKIQIFLSGLFMYLILLNPLIWQKHGNLIKCFNVIINPFIWISIIVCGGSLLDNENIGWLLYILVLRGRPDEPGIERRVLISKILCRIIRPEKLYFNFLLHFDRMKTFRKCSRFCKFSPDWPSFNLCKLGYRNCAAGTRELSPPSDWHFLTCAH